MKELLILKEKFYSQYFTLDEGSILEMTNYDNGPISNVVNGLCDEAFGISLIDEKSPINYQLFYITGKSTLEGHLIQMDIDDPERDELLFLFCQYLVESFPKLDTIDIFNGFQMQTRTMLEKFGFWTYSPDEINSGIGDNVSIIVKDKLGVYKIPFIDKSKFFKQLLDSNFNEIILEGEEHVYLMMNLKNNLFKIGQSQKPGFREKTLQGEEPEVVMIACWRAPKKVEKELHAIYCSKRIRGEWFKLSLNDVKNIKGFMAHYKL